MGQYRHSDLWSGKNGVGPPVILLHGFPENADSWRHQMQPLADAGFTAIAPDLRGYRHSFRPPHVEDYRMRHLIDDVADLVHATGEKSAHIVGHDWGGVIAWTFAGAYPELTRKLVILNAPHMYLYRKALRKPYQFFRSWYVALFLIPGLAEKILSRNDYAALRDIFRNGPAVPGTFTEQQINDYVDAAAQPGALTAMLNYYRALRDPGSAAIARAAQAECETLVIWGEKDRALSVRLLDDIETVAPRVRIRRIPEAGHWVQNEVPTLVTETLIQFLLEPEQAVSARPEPVHPLLQKSKPMSMNPFKRR
jgi:pimeloyl-ACP methyl ester carboxylesterase